MTDTVTPRDPYEVLRAVLLKASPGASWTVDNWREEADLAGLTGAERGEAQQQAARDGFLAVLGEYRDVGFCYLVHASTAPLARRRPVQVYERTDKPLPGQPVHEEIVGQLALVEVP